MNVIKLFLPVCALLVAIAPIAVSGKEIVIKSLPGESFILDKVISVGIDDTLRIYQGTNIEVRPGAGIYTKGSVFIGIDQNPDMSSTSSKTITIVSSSTKPFLDADGASVIVLDTVFKGAQFTMGYRKADISISSTTLIDTTATAIYSNKTFVSIFSDSLLDLSYSTIISQNIPYDPLNSVPSTISKNYLFEIFLGSHATITATRIYSDIAKEVINVYDNSKITFENGNILACTRWLTVFKFSRATGTLNSPTCSEPVQLVFNQSTSDVVFEDTKCCSSVLLIPGLQASRLYKKQIYENRLWEPNRDTDVEKLFMDSSGKSILGGIYTRDIIDRIEVMGFGLDRFSYYSSFLGFLKKIKDEHFIQDFQIFAYDWRKSPEEIATDDLDALVERMALDSSNGKVTLVAHSYGGFITKVLLKKLKDKNKHHLIDRVVMVAVPETGAPTALFSSLHGENQSILKGFVQKARTGMNLAINMSSAYAMLPTSLFTKNIPITLKISSQTVSKKYDIPKPVRLLSAISWIQAMVGQVGNMTLTDGSILIQKPSNTVLESKINDEWTRMQQSNATLGTTYRIWSLAGMGIQTIHGMDYEYILHKDCKQIPCINKPVTLKGVPTYTSEGDGTVVFDSMQSRIGTVLKANLSKINEINKKNIKHANILESADIQATIKSILITAEPVESHGYIYLTDEKPDPAPLYTTMVEGQVVGGITYEYEGKKLETKVMPGPSGYTIIEEVPNSSIIKTDNSITITSQTRPTSVTFVSDKNQRLNIRNIILLNTVYGSQYIGPDYIATMTNYTPPNIYQNIPVGAGSVVEVRPASSTIVIDIDGDGDIDREYESEPFATSTASSTVTIATTTASTSIQIAMFDLALNIQKVNSLIIESNNIQMLGLKSVHSQKLLKSKSVLVNALSTYKLYFGNDGGITHSMTAKIIQAESEKVFLDLLATRKTIDRILEQEEIYREQVEGVDAYILERGVRGVSKKTLAKKENAENHLQDLALLYVMFSELEDAELEFLSLHGSISSERLQRP